MPYTVANPSPEPCPTSLVVKYGSKTLSRMAGSIPLPVSATASTTYRPGGTGGSAASWSGVAIRASETPIVSVPPFGMASRALTARLTTTCSSWLASAMTGDGTGEGSTVNRTVSPIRRSSIGANVTTSAETSTTAGWRGCFRP